VRVRERCRAKDLREQLNARVRACMCTCVRELASSCDEAEAEQARAHYTLFFVVLSPVLGSDGDLI